MSSHNKDAQHGQRVEEPPPPPPPQPNDVAAQHIQQQLAAQHLETTTTTVDTSMETDQQHGGGAGDDSMGARKRQLDEISNGAPTSATRSSASPSTTTSAQQHHSPSLLRYDAAGRVLDLPQQIRKLRLEAMFYPKFENESVTDHEIRQQMETAVEAGRGYLETSLKHSGSLLLWSGGQRFYSKNSTDNVFTHVGEILLRQHLARAFWQQEEEHKNAKNKHQDDNGNDDEKAATKNMFEECSAHVQKHRLTLSFEVVTACLGDHGDRPKREFLILTAVADRHQERFWGTNEIVEFAQRFRLPHNDAWIFSTDKSVRALFAFYDQARETSLATDVVEALSASADTRVESMLPHVDFQGNILEGIVIRFVAYPTASDAGLLEKIKVLAEQSRQIAQQVPPSRPDAWELFRGGEETENVDSLLKVNVRELYEQTKFGKKEGPTSFAAAIEKVMDASLKRRRVERVPKSAADIDLPAWSRDMIHSGDDESQRIAKLVDLLTSINVRVNYGIMRERIPGHKDRWLCIIHVLHDFSFQKYRKRMAPGDMTLFRGFAIEINGNENESHGSQPAAYQNNAQSAGESLMLKMKFLPYMVRTFGTRNGLKTLRQGGIEAFVKYTNSMLAKWSISKEGREKWVPFFRGWAEFALPRMEATWHAEAGLRPLSEDNYLEHLEVFQTQYDAGKFDRKLENPSTPDSRNVGLVVVVSPKRELAKSVADLVARSLDNAQRIDDINAISKEDMETFCLPGHGVVCSAEVIDGVGTLRRYIGNFGKFISVILVGCSDDAIPKLVLADDLKLYKGLTGSWRKTRAVLLLELDPTTVFPQLDVTCEEAPRATSSAAFISEMEKIRLVFQTESQGGPSPGMLVFFPGIPGCGKTTIASEEVVKILKDECPQPTKEREIILRQGDKTKGKYWALVKQERKKNTSCLYIADKNTPAPSWGYVATVCAETKAMGVPVVPDSAALHTTVVDGIRKPDGSFDSERRHIYPFTLQYLAVCLLRVISRSPQSHAGKLDAFQERACMIVLNFYSLYRRTTAEEYRENLEHQFHKSGAVLGSPIEVPFFAKTVSSEMPIELESLLVEALQAFYGYDVSKNDPTKVKDAYIADLESRLRRTLQIHADFIRGLTIDISESRKVFVSKFFQRVAELESIESWVEAETGTKANFIQLASVDVNASDVHSLLASLCEEVECLAPLTEQLLGKEAVLTESSFLDRCFIPNTHITMAHFKENSQNEMRAKFGSLVGAKVELKVLAILWDERIAAFEMQLPDATTDGSFLPGSKNDFSHITIWCQQGASALRANDLPSKVAKGEAKRVALPQPSSLMGEVSLWI